MAAGWACAGRLPEATEVPRGCCGWSAARWRRRGLDLGPIWAGGPRPLRVTEQGGGWRRRHRGADVLAAVTWSGCGGDPDAAGLGGRGDAGQGLEACFSRRDAAAEGR